MNYFHEKLPEIGQKFVAVFADGSGAELFLRIDSNRDTAVYIHHDGIEDCDLDEQNYLFWLPIPDDFTLWFEGCDK